MGNTPTSKIGQKYTKNTKNHIFRVCLTYFCPILRVVVFSYPVEGQVFPKFLSNPPKMLNIEPLKRFYQTPRGYVEPPFGTQKDSIEP